MCKRNLFTCSQDTQEKIKKMIEEHHLTRVVVASCTPRTHEPLFQETCSEAGLNRYLFEMANIRDQCSWVHMHEPEMATDKAKDLVRMAVSKSRALKPLQRQRFPLTKKALVLGGGLAGMSAAVGLAEQGYPVALVEREGELGGNLQRIHSTIQGNDAQKLLAELKEKVEKDDLIEVSQRIHSEPELGHQEQKASRLLTERFKEHGYETRIGVSGMETAFTATMK